jgi:hypothetical protein
MAGDTVDGVFGRRKGSSRVLRGGGNLVVAHQLTRYPLLAATQRRAGEERCPSLGVFKGG